MGPPWESSMTCPIRPLRCASTPCGGVGLAARFGAGPPAESTQVPARLSTAMAAPPGAATNASLLLSSWIRTPLPPAQARTELFRARL